MAATREGILSTIGKTPLVQLTRVFGDCHFRLFAKLEGFNPGGSIKDRPALRMIEAGIEAGQILPDTVIIESSSGNLGIGLAQVCLYLGLRFVCVIDPKTTTQNRRLLEAYGAELDLVSEPDPLTREFLQARLARVRALLKSFERAYWPNQYANLNNPGAHHATMKEIVEGLGHPPDYLFCSTSTCGTLRGCAEYARKQPSHPPRVVAVDAVGSVIFSGATSKRLIPGHGASVRPELYEPDLADQCVHVSDWDCIVGCRMLLAREALLVGGSSGATLIAAQRSREEIPKGATVVLVFADRGERYLDTVFSDEWVAEHFPDTTTIQSAESAAGRAALGLTATGGSPKHEHPPGYSYRR